MGGMYDPAHPGEIIREAIVAEGWTVGDAAARLGATPATGCVCRELTSWRKPGKPNPRPKTGGRNG